mgnify:CR=1 FL=1
MPQKYSESYDHWGYYNAEENRSNESYWDQALNKRIFKPYFLPELMVMDYSHFNKDMLFEGANRETNGTVLKNGILTSIKYPTKGLVSFEYEPNTFKLPLSELNTSYGLLKYEDKYDNISYDVVNYAESVNACQGCMYEDNPTEYIEIAQTTTIKVNFEYYPYGSIQNPQVPVDGSGNGSSFGVVTRIDGGGAFTKVYRFIPGDIAHSYSEEFELNPGRYVITATSGGDHFTTRGSAIITNVNEMASSKEMIGGGLRIKKIISEKNTREFLYNKYEDEQKTSGLLLVEPYYSFVNYGMFNCGPSFMRNSNVVFPLSENSSGATVGYSCVQEVISDGNDSSIHVSRFNNNSQGQTRGSNLPIVLNYKNGLISEELFKSNEKLISKNIYEYSDLLGIPYQYPETYFMRINFTTDNNYYSINYYRVDPKWYGLESKSTFDYYYDSSGSSKEVSTITDYQYNTSNYQVSQADMVDSDGTLMRTKTYYPADVTSVSSLAGGNLTPTEYNAIDRLKDVRANGSVGLHQTAVPIQRETYVNGTRMSIQRTIYKDWGNNIILPEKVLTSKGSAALESRLEYKRYDSYGNPTEIKQTNGATIVYLWGYNGQYPVAKIENSSYTAVINTGVNLSVLTSVTSSESSKLSELNKIRNHSSMSNAQVTTYTHDPLVGVSTITGPRGVKTSYDYDSFNRLEFIKDETGKLLEHYKYHYKN